MNHYAARLRQKDGRWDYTSANRRANTRPVGYCAGWLEPEDYPEVVRLSGNFESLKLWIDELRPFKDKFHSDGHATEAEACSCYREYILDHRLKLRPESMLTLTPDSKNRCKFPGCDVFTAGFAELDLHLWPLCEEHCTRDVVEQLMPTIGESWSSY